MTANKPRRRYFRYSLRTLFLAVTLFCVWIGMTAKRARDQRLAVDAILKLEADVSYEHEYNSAGNRLMDSEIESWIPQFLLTLAGKDFFYDVQSISIGLPQEIDERSDEAAVYREKVFERLLAIPRLRSLTLDETLTSDEAMRYVGQLTHLESLTIYYGSQLTDVGISQLRHLRRLSELDINQRMWADPDDEENPEPQFTEKTFEVIGHLPRLRTFYFGGEALNDAGLMHLSNASRLRSIMFSSRAVTRQGINEFRAVLPFTKVNE